MVLWTEVPEGRDLIRTETLCYDLDVSLRTSLCGIISLGVAVLLLHNIIPRSLDLPPSWVDESNPSKTQV